jgi:hypothetical protein
MLQCARALSKLTRAAICGSCCPTPRISSVHASAFCSDRGTTPRKETVLLGIIGTFSGCVGPLVGVGGGIISIPIWREFTQLPQKMLSATSLVAVGVSAGTASVAFAQVGHVNFAAAGDISRSLFMCCICSLICFVFPFYSRHDLYCILQRLCP